MFIRAAYFFYWHSLNSIQASVMSQCGQEWFWESESAKFGIPVENYPPSPLKIGLVVSQIKAKNRYFPYLPMHFLQAYWRERVLELDIDLGLVL